MSELMREERDWLLCFCMKSEENTRLALAIGQIKPDLEREIRQSFLKTFQKKLDERIRGKLGDLWEGEIPEVDVDWSEDNKIYEIRKDTIKIRLFYQPYHQNQLYIGLPVVPEVDQMADLEKDRFASVFGAQGLKLQSAKAEPDWHWWFYPRDDHRRLEDLSRLHHDKVVRSEKIEYFTDILVFTATAISKGLEQ